MVPLVTLSHPMDSVRAGWSVCVCLFVRAATVSSRDRCVHTLILKHRHIELI